MSRRSLLLAASLTANAVLGVVWWQRNVKAESRALALDHATAAAERAPAAAQAKVASVADWATLNAATSDAEFVAGLKREGFSLRVIRELLKLRLREKYADRLRALEQRQPVVPYWRQRAAPQEIDLEARAKLRALNQEITNEIKQLLGPDVFQLPGDYAYENRERLYGSIPSEKIAGIEAINADYNEMANQIREAARGVIFPEDRDKLNFLEQERLSDLKRLLTLDELAQYDRRSSPTALALRSQLRWFGPNEEEYVAVFGAQRAFDEKYGVQNLSGEQADRRRDARPELFAALETALGSQRFEDYRLMTDGNYGGTATIVQSIGLPPERAKDLVRIQQDARDRAEALRREPDLSVDERSSRLNSLQLEAREKVAAIVGANQVGAYEEGAGRWIGEIVPAKR